MNKISFELLLKACKTMKAREDNRGCWADEEIPQVFRTIHDQYYPNMDMEDGTWLWVMEAVVKNNAVNFVAVEGDSR